VDILELFVDSESPTTAEIVARLGLPSTQLGHQPGAGATVPWSGATQA
jgi:hypothetical protein